MWTTIAAIGAHFAKHYWKYLAAIVIAILAWWRIYDYGSDKYDAGRASVLNDDAAAMQERDKENARELGRREQLLKQVNDELAQTKATLAAERAARPRTVIRLRTVQASDHCGGVSSDTGTATGDDGRLRGELQQALTETASTDFDTGPLFDITDEADLEHAECTKLKKWVRGLKR